MYYPSSENKGADQLRGYREADLRLCFRICKTLVFIRSGSFFTSCKTFFFFDNRQLHFLPGSAFLILMTIKIVENVFISLQVITVFYFPLPLIEKKQSDQDIRCLQFPPYLLNVQFKFTNSCFKAIVFVSEF